MGEYACLIIHGFGGDFTEIDYLANFLAHRQIETHKVLLAGHGKAKSDLRQSNHKAWLASVAAALRTLEKTHRRVVLIGFSMGGLLAMHFANRPSVEKIIFVNTPIYFWNLRIIAGDILAALRSRRFEKLKYYSNATAKIPVISGLHFLALLTQSIRLVKKVDCPALILQCRNDESVNYRSALYLQKHLKGKAFLRLYPGGQHQVFDVPGLRDRVCGDVLHFLAKQL